MKWEVFLLSCLVVLSGCAGVSDTAPTESSVETTAPARSTTPDQSTTSARSTTATPEETPRRTSETPDQSTTEPPTTTSIPTTTRAPTPTPPDNPWNKNPVVVSVENEAGYAHQKYEIFERALAYWEENAEQYAGFHVDFELDPGNASPDVTIEYVDRIEGCGEAEDTRDALGCAPLYLHGEAADHTEIQIRESDDDEQLLATTKHEFGHVLGIEHGAEPMPLMAENNLYLRASPWEYPDITYYVDYSDKPGVSEERLEEEIDPALEYFEDGADGHLDTPPTFERVDRRSDSNVVIEIHADSRQEDSFSGSTAWTSEGVIEGQFYRRYTVRLYDLDRNAMSWHIAYQLSRPVLENVDTSPAVFDSEECDYHCRRGNWWR